MPSEFTSADMQFKTLEERKVHLQIDAQKRWLENCMDAAKFSALCQTDKNGLAPPAVVQGILTSKLCIGLGNREPLERIFAPTGADSCIVNGLVDIMKLLA